MKLRTVMIFLACRAKDLRFPALARIYAQSNGEFADVKPYIFMKIFVQPRDESYDPCRLLLRLQTCENGAVEIKRYCGGAKAFDDFTLVFR